MVMIDNFKILSDEERSQFKFDFCQLCEFYESCELIGEYEQYKESHNRYSKLSNEKEVVRATIRREKTHDSSKKVVHAIIKRKAPYESSSAKEAEPNPNILSYNEKELENGCIMSYQHVWQIECGEKRVSEGIGDHFKIETDYEGNIKEGTTDRWEPLQPVFISAQTGQGKNYFIENTLIPYVRELNYRKKTNYKILILSNRLALEQQIENRLEGNDDLDNEEGIIYSYGECADVMTYQSLLRNENKLKKKQKKENPRYIFVICDEAHFFTSDAMFNPHTKKILEAIVRLFQDAVRVYMSATPYECLEYIIKVEEKHRKCLNQNKCQDEWKGGMMVLYHFKRDYSYLDIKTYSSISELYDEIVESVEKRKEKWLIFIDDKEKCKKAKTKLDKVAKDKGYLWVIEDKKSKKKDGEEVETDKDDEAENKAEKKPEKVFAVNADSKKDPDYQEIVKKESLNKDTYVLISTSVLDNGVNLTGINNIVVSDMSKVKCLQMVGRARVEDINDRKTLYVKRFNKDVVDKRIKNLMRQQDAYHDYELAYGELCNPLQSRGYSEYQFLEKFYNGKEEDWKDAKHWFGRLADEPRNLYLNKIAKSLVDDRLLSQYECIRDEMIEEESKENEQQGQSVVIHTGQKYLEHQLSWFGKKYCVDDDITYADKEKPKKELIAFLKSYADSGEKIDGSEKMESFQNKFAELHDAVFPRADKNLDRFYGYKKMNDILTKRGIEYKIVGRAQVGPWRVVRKDGNELDQADVSDIQADEETIQEKSIEPAAEMLDTREQADNDEPVLSKSEKEKYVKAIEKVVKNHSMRHKKRPPRCKQQEIKP